MLSRAPLVDGDFEGDSLATLRARGWDLTRLDASTIAERFPAWRLGPAADGYLNPRGGWAESGAVVARLLAECTAAGVTLREGVRVTRLQQIEDRVTGVESSAGPLSADTVVVAAGAWTPSLVPWLADRLWASGHPVLHFRPADPAPWRPPRFLPWAADISRTGFYGFPANADGIVKVANHGVGLRVSPDDPRTLPPDTEHHFRTFLRQTLPDLADAPLVGERLCLYCDTFDGDFWIAADPARKGLVVATGGAGHGFKFAPLLGDLAGDAVDGIDGPWAHRFRWRHRGALRTEDARHNGGAP